MKFSTIVSYKVIETDKALVLLYAGDKLGGNRPGTFELIIADLGTCCEFMARYTHERANGRDPVDARTWALKGAQIHQPTELDAAGGKH